MVLHGHLQPVGRLGPGKPASRGGQHRGRRSLLSHGEMAAPEAEAEPLWEGRAAPPPLGALPGGERRARPEGGGAAVERSPARPRLRHGVCLRPRQRLGKSRACAALSPACPLVETRRLVRSCGEAMTHQSCLGGWAAAWLLFCRESAFGTTVKRVGIRIIGWLELERTLKIIYPVMGRNTFH